MTDKESEKQESVEKTQSTASEAKASDGNASQEERKEPSATPKGPANTKQDHKAYKQFTMSIIGMFVLVLGVTLILVWWSDVIALFKGFLGIAFAVGGLLVLYSIKQ